MEPIKLPKDRSQTDDAGAGYATPEEVMTALNGLSDVDYSKLMIIARSFCRSRHLHPSVLEPEELLSEAVASTLNPDGKKWRKTVPIVKHLDRAMENISGHLVRENSKVVVVSFPNGFGPAETSDLSTPTQPSAADLLEERQEVDSLLRRVFGDDDRAIQVFLKRVDGYTPAETIAQLEIDATEHDTVTRRIRRKIAKFLSA